MRLAFAVMVSVCLLQDRTDVISTPRSRWDDAFQFNVACGIGAIKADAFSADTKVFTLMFLEIMFVYCGTFTQTVQIFTGRVWYLS